MFSKDMLGYLNSTPDTFYNSHCKQITNNIGLASCYFRFVQTRNRNNWSESNGTSTQTECKMIVKLSYIKNTIRNI